MAEAGDRKNCEAELTLSDLQSMLVGLQSSVKIIERIPQAQRWNFGAENGNKQSISRVPQDEK